MENIVPKLLSLFLEQGMPFIVVVVAAYIYRKDSEEHRKELREIILAKLEEIHDAVKQCPYISKKQE